MKVEVWSDVVCAWCYIAKRRLERALERFGHQDEVQVVWRSFELHPGAPNDGAPVADAVAARTGRPLHEVRRALAQVGRVALEDGLEMDVRRARDANTFLAHQLVHLGREEGIGGQVLERLMRAHLVEGRHVGDLETLVPLGAQAGLDPDRVRAGLRDGRRAGSVRADGALARAIGVEGVPYLLLDRRFSVAGAKPVELFHQALEVAWSRRGEGAASASSD